jgi:HAD superfamily hydrolase (TIGR01509 family)
MIQAIVFDCFGVLATDGWLPFRQKYFGDNPELLQQATDLNKQVDAGMADYEDFIQTLSQLANVPVAEARSAIEDNQPNEPLFAFIKELKPKYKIGLLSNAGANWLNDIFTPEQVALFDAISLSFETGFVKPDPRAYQSIADRLGVPPEDCILIDDQERYAAGANEVGMQMIVYKDFEQVKADLKARLAADPKD